MQKAIACIQGNGIRGSVKFYPQFPGVLITAEIFGLSDGFHGFHIHEGSGCTGLSYAETGGHWNPGGESHPDHAGDLPSLLSCQRKAYLSFFTNRFTIPDVIGRTIVIHSGADDFRSQPAGNAGEKIACGVINCC